MNNEMMPLFAFLLQSEDLKKQSDRIIQEVRISNDTKKLGDEFVASITAEVVKANAEFQDKQIGKMKEISDSINDLKTKIEDIINPYYSKTPIFNDTNDTTPAKTEKRGLKK